MSVSVTEFGGVGGTDGLGPTMNASSIADTPRVDPRYYAEGATWEHEYRRDQETALSPGTVGGQRS